jgi:hypothetical protein
MKVKPSWDFGAIISASDDISAGSAVHIWGYFQEYFFILYPAVIVGTFKFLIGGNMALTGGAVSVCKKHDIQPGQANLLIHPG